MELLEYYQNQQHSSDHYVTRKCQLPIHRDINLYGVRGSGKTTMILDLLSQEESETTLYIDFQDPNLIQDQVHQVLHDLDVIDEYTEYIEYLDETFSDTRPPEPRWPVVLDTKIDTVFGTMDAKIDRLQADDWDRFMESVEERKKQRGM